MSSVVISGDTSGAITLSAPAVAGTNTITLPAQTGTAMVNGPAFFAYSSAGTAQSISQNTWTKVTFNTESFDTASCFASSRFTPTVAGYYQVNCSVVMDYTVTPPTAIGLSVYKNGADYNRSLVSFPAATQIYSTPYTYSTLVYLNGTTDYIELYGFENGGNGGQFYGSGINTSFSGALIRGA